MKKKIVVAVAWPYANGEPHLGHIAGMNIPADIFARYHRLKGNRVVKISGSDMHGTPTMLSAIDSNKTPQEIAFHFHRIWKNCFERMNFSYDIYTHTATKNHRDFVQNIFLILLEKGYIYKKTQVMPYSLSENFFLPDRLVIGTCPYCASKNARGDQCTNCNKTLDPIELIDIKSVRDGTSPEFRETEHYFLRLTEFKKPLHNWLKSKSDWRPNAKNQALQIVETIRDRAITRDIPWGIPVPIENYTSKCIYVWFEAVLGYITATKEWSEKRGNPKEWQDFWEDEKTQIYYFQGKDNIPFHAVILPAILMAVGKYTLATDVVANEFLNSEVGKMSKSASLGIWLNDYLKYYKPDPLRYYLASILPETADSVFKWEDFYRTNNNELVANLGNFVNRTLSMVEQYFNRTLKPVTLSEVNNEMLEACQNTFEIVGESIEQRHFKLALRGANQLISKANRYLDAKSPWHTIKTDEVETHKTLWTALQVVSNAGVIFSPFIPESMEKLEKLLNSPNYIVKQGWKFQTVKNSITINSPEILFEKLESIEKNSH